MEDNRRRMMNGREVGAPTQPQEKKGMRLMTLEVPPKEKGPRRAAESIERPSDPELVAVNEIVKQFRASLERAEADVDNYEGFDGTTFENPFREEAETMLGLLKLERDRMYDLRDKQLPARYLDMEDRLNAEEGARAGDVLLAHEFTQRRRVAGMKRGVDGMREYASRVGAEGITVSETLTNVMQRSEVMPDQFIAYAGKIMTTTPVVEKFLKDGDTSEEARASGNYLMLVTNGFEKVRDEIVHYMIVPLLNTVPEKIAPLLSSENGAEIPTVHRKYVDAERMLHSLRKKVEAYLTAQDTKEAIEESDVISDEEMYAFFACVEPIIDTRKYLLSESAPEKAFEIIDRAKVGVHDVFDKNMQDTDKMNHNLALIRQNAVTLKRELHSEYANLQEVLGAGVSNLDDIIHVIENLVDQLYEGERTAASEIKKAEDSADKHARRGRSAALPERDLSGIETWIRTRRQALITEIKARTVERIPEGELSAVEVLPAILSVVAAREERVAAIAITDGVDESVVNRRAIANGRSKNPNHTRGELQGTPTVQQRRGLGRFGLKWGKGNRQ